MVMESAQRVIAVSLGKMASSRTQRGGVRLHRSLLVAGVLMNARTATHLCEHDSDDLDSVEELNADAELVETWNVECRQDALTALLPPSPADSRLNADDRLPAVVVETYVDSDLSNTAMSDTGDLILKHDSSLKRTSESVDTVVETDRKRKRPSAAADDNLESVEVKRLRCSDLSSQELSCGEQPVATDSSSDWEDSVNMDLDNIQLSSLVHCFNSGFQGLLSTTGSSADSSSTYMYSLDSVGDRRHNMSTSESIISCSIQIREALETLSRPALALSV